MIKKIQRKFALSEIGAKNLIKACISCTISYLVLAMSIGILYAFTNNLLLPLLDNKNPVFNYGFYILSFIVMFALIYGAHLIQYDMTYLNTYKESSRIRISLAEHLRKIPLSFFTKRDISDLTSTILGDVTYMEQALSHFIPEFVGSILSTIILCIGMFSFNFKMALSAVWCVPVSFILIALANKRMTCINNEFNKLQINRANKIQEGLESIRDLKSNDYTKKYLEEVNKSIDECEKKQIRLELTNALFVTGAQLILKLGIVSVVVVGTNLLIKNTIDLSVFLLFIIVASRLYDPLNATLQNLAAIISCKPHSDRLREINEHHIQSGKKNFESDNYNLVFENVKFGYYKGQTIINDVSFTAKQGEITALIGPSGGGKSTIAKLAARFWDIDEGKITIGGENIAEIDPETLLSKYAIVFQDVVLFNTSVMENIRLGKKEATDEEVLRAAKMACCDEFVNKLEKGYATEIGENGANLSGGERQRISIARAILKDAPIILLDEATASLDVENETYVQNALSGLIKNKTVIIIAHRMRTISNADHLIVLEEGRIIEEGTPEELEKKNGIYKHMKDLQSINQNWKIS